MSRFGDLCVAICSDVTVPYDELGLEGCHYLAHPGLCDAQALLEHNARHQRDNGGRKPRFLLGPHEGCLAEENPLHSAMLTAATLRAQGCRAAIPLSRPGKPLCVPATCTFPWIGLEDVLEALWSVSGEDIDWSYQRKVPTERIHVARSFREVPRDGTLRFMADAIYPDSILTVKTVIGHFSGGRDLPIEFGDDLDAATTCRLGLMLRGQAELVAA